MSDPMREFLDDRLEEGVGVTWDDCDDAIIGIVERCGQTPLVCYDYDLLVRCFVDDETSYDEAMEWVDYNIVGAWVGDGTPMILYRPETP